MALANFFKVALVVFSFHFAANKQNKDESLIGKNDMNKLQSGFKEKLNVLSSRISKILNEKFTDLQSDIEAMITSDEELPIPKMFYNEREINKTKICYEDYPMNLTCLVENQSLLTMHILFNGIELYTPLDGQYYVPMLAVKDSGYYTCRALFKNFRESSITTRIYIQNDPKQELPSSELTYPKTPIISVYKNSIMLKSKSNVYQIAMDDSVRVKCTEYISSSSIIFDGNPLKSCTFEYPETITVEFKAAPHDSGRYLCRAISRDYVEKSVSVYLSVTRKYDHFSKLMEYEDFEAQKKRIKKSKITPNNAVNTTNSLVAFTSENLKGSTIKNNDDVTFITDTLERVIEEGTAIKDDPTLVLEVFDNMLNFSNDFLLSKEKKASETTVASNLINLLNQASQGLNSTRIQKYNRVAIAAYAPVVSKNKSSYDDIIIFDPTKLYTFATTKIDSVKKIQIAVNISRIMEKKITFTMIEDATLMTVQEEGHKSNIVTSVISATVEELNSNDTMDAADVTIDLTPNEIGASVVCVYWDTIKLAWSSQGCITEHPNEQSQTRRCKCSHLTSFALLMKVDCTSASTSASHEFALSMASYICLTLSSVSLILIIGIYTCYLFRSRAGTATNVRQIKNILALSATLLTANLAFIIGGYFSAQLESKSIICKLIGCMLHFGYLSSILWSFVEAASVFNSIVRLHYSSGIHDTYVTHYFLKASIVAWGIPACIVAITAGIYRGENYGYDVCAGIVDNTADNVKLDAGGLCFLKQKSFYIAFMAPVALVLCFNLIILLLIVPIILKCGKKSVPTASNTKQHSGQSVKGILGLICVLSLTWIFGYMQISHGKVIFQYIFTLTTSLQGFFILVFFILLKPNIRNFVLSKSTSGTGQSATSRL